ncbi:hypothetical protein EV383_3023 [Pseudonocardia sediminis]|uniref:Uncharacterized protein n=1 Tax=Pseudonocardia sediminis TaxID=1397368 RepID=A0A4Q7UYD8_PSEST|nr:hypothetical protein [Pseudonocardia sediminis]RZT86134.1 hypothetical protein EV383_3023 [Pseudonocardia sediminis]
MTAPDVAGVVVGWRTWQVRDPGPAAHRGPVRPGPVHPGAVRLRSPVKVSTDWPAGAALEARCELRGHPAPEPSCTCGLYAARDPADVGGVGFGGATLLGCVAMWGTVVEGERGWRAGTGRPVALFCGPALSEDVRAGLAVAYGVPVHRLGRPVAVTVEQAGIGAAADRLRTVLGETPPPDAGAVDDAVRAFTDAVGRPPAHGTPPGPGPGSRPGTGQGSGRGLARRPRRTAVGTALLAAVAASALLLTPSGQGADPAPATPAPSITPAP